MTHVAVVGAGIAGLATAWFLQEHGVEVTVLERSRVGSDVIGVGLVHPAAC